MENSSMADAERVKPLCQAAITSTNDVYSVSDFSPRICHRASIRYTGRVSTNKDTKNSSTDICHRPKPIKNGLAGASTMMSEIATATIVQMKAIICLTFIVISNNFTSLSRTLSILSFSLTCNNTLHR